MQDYYLWALFAAAMVVSPLWGWRRFGFAAAFSGMVAATFSFGGLPLSDQLFVFSATLAVSYFLVFGEIQSESEDRRPESSSNILISSGEARSVMISDWLEDGTAEVWFLGKCVKARPARPELLDYIGIFLVQSIDKQGIVIDADISTLFLTRRTISGSSVPDDVHVPGTAKEDITS